MYPRTLILLLAAVLIVPASTAAVAGPTGSAPDANHAPIPGVGSAVGHAPVASGGSAHDIAPNGSGPSASAAAPVAPQFDVSVPEPTLVPGTTQELTIQVVNDPFDPNETAKPARNVRVTVQDSPPVDVTSDTRAIGPVEDGKPATVTVGVTVPASAEGGSYTLPVLIEYEYRNDEGEVVAEETFANAEVRIENRARFRVESTESSAPIGGTGTVAVEVTNVGSAPASDASVTLTSTSPSITMGRSGSASRYVGAWEAGETRTLEYDVTVADGAERRSYALQAQVNYQNTDGVPASSPPLSLGVTPTAPDVPRIGASVPEPTLVPGTTQQVTVQLVNDAADPNDTVATAREVEVTVDEAGPVEVTSGPRSIEPLVDGRPAVVTVGVTVPADAEPGTYQLPVEVAYEYSTGDGDTRADRTTATAAVEVESRARFRVESTEVAAPIGDTGTVAVTVTNVGSAPARDAAVRLSSTSPDVTLGRSGSASRYVGRWEPGESRTLEYDVAVAGDAEPRSYALQAQVNYENTDGVPAGSAPLRVGVTPDPEQTFAVENVESTLRVGAEGEIVAEIVNTGENTAENVVVNLQVELPTLTPLEPQYSVGTLEPGERETVRFDVDTSQSARAGPRQVTMGVAYRTADGERRAGDSQDVRVQVRPRRPTFDVEPVDAEFSAGGSGELVLEVTNNGSEPISDLSAKLFAGSPISTNDDEAFAESLAPGESTRLTFGVGVGGGAIAKSYPVSVDFRYEDSDGETRLSDTYQVPVQVTESDGGGGPLSGLPVSLPVLVVVVVVIVLAVAGYRYLG